MVDIQDLSDDREVARPLGCSGAAALAIQRYPGNERLIGPLL